jgi:hypothetical protein
MWNYLLGVKPPSESEKKKRKFESTKEYYKGYDKDKSARKYLPEWEKGRPWLKYVDDKGMVCTARTEFGELNGMFVTGCTSYKVDSLTKHEKSKQHEKCALITKAKLKSCEE